MSAVDAKPPQHPSGVVGGTCLRICVHGIWTVRRRPASRGIGDAPVTPRKVTHLRLPAEVVAAELVQKENGVAAPALFAIKAYPVVGGDMGYGPDSSLTYALRVILAG